MGVNLGAEAVGKHYLDSGVAHYIGPPGPVDQRIGLWFLLDVFTSFSHQVETLDLI